MLMDRILPPPPSRPSIVPDPSAPDLVEVLPSQVPLATQASDSCDVSLGQDFPDLFDTGLFSVSHQRQPIVFQEGEHLRLWFSPTRKSEDIHLLSSCPVDELAHIVESTPMYLGCAVRTSSLSLPVELCRPDGSCGLQFACVVLLEHESWHPDPHSTGYFDSPERKDLLYNTLEQWVKAFGIPSDTLLKI